MQHKNIQQISSIITPILLANRVEYAALFGSVSRGEATDNSDIDILIRYSETPGLLSHIGLMQELKDNLSSNVDLVTEQSLSKILVPFVKKDLYTLYGKANRPDLH